MQKSITLIGESLLRSAWLFAALFIGANAWADDEETSSSATADIELTAQDPEDEAEVSSLYEIYVTVGYEDFYLNTTDDLTELITVYNRTTGTFYTVDDVWKVRTSTTTLGIALAEEVTAGEDEDSWVIVSIPEGVVGDADWYNASYADGHTNAAAAFYYNLKASDEEGGDGTDDELVFGADPADGSTVSSLSTITFYVDEKNTTCYSTWSYNAYVYDEDGNVVEEIDVNKKVENGSDTDWSTYNYTWVTYTLTEEIVKAGTYTVKFPAGSFEIDGSTYDEDITLTYIVDGSLEPAYWLTTSPEDGSTVKSLSTISVTFDDYTSVNCTSYLYLYSDEELTTQATYGKPSVEGNTVTFTLAKEITEAGTYYLVIKSGKVVLDNTSSTTEDIVLTYTVEPLPYNMTIDPADQSEVESLSTITITFDDYDEITKCSGSPYVYTADGEYVTYGSYTVENNTLTITLKKEVTDAGSYIVKVGGSAVYLGPQENYETSTAFNLEYTIPSAEIEEDVTTVSLVTPAEGSSIETFEAGYIVQFDVQSTKTISDVTYTIVNAETGEYLKTLSYLTYNSETGYYEGEIIYDTDVETGTYTITVKVYTTSSSSTAELEQTFTIYGTAEAYENSSIQFVSSDPEADSYINQGEDCAITYTFDGLVNINSTTSFVNYGQGVTYDFQSIEAGDDAVEVDGVTYSTTWTVTVSSSIIDIFVDDNYITLTIVAVDQNGARVLGNEGAEDYTYFSFDYYITKAEEEDTTNEWTSDPAEGSVSSLSTIYIYCNGGETSVAPSWSVAPTLTDAEGNEIAIDYSYDFSWDDGSSRLIITLNEELTTAGTYTLTWPVGSLMVNDTDYYSVLTLTYTISSTNGINGIAPNADGTYEIYNINGVKASGVNTLSNGLYIINGKKVVIKK